MTKTEARKYLTIGNHKLGKTIGSWSLPASKEVCNRICDGCYAIKAQRIYPAVLPSRERKLKVSKSAQFPTRMISSIKALNPEYVRVHDSGEFYSQEYVAKWVTIAKALPHVKMYTYTKRLKDFDFTELKALDNFVLVDSLHSGKLNYGAVDKKPEDMFLCPDYKGSKERLANPKGQICGVTCNYCMTKAAEKTGVYFVKH